MKLFSTHSTWIKGAKSFGEWLTRIRGVAYVNQGNVRSSHVSAGTRQPTVKLTENSIIVEYFSEGKLQRFFVFKLDRISWPGLKKRIVAALRDREKRGGVGQSSKAEIEIPVHIRRRAVADEAARAALAAGEAVVLSKRVAEGYALLLEKFPETQAEHILSGVYTLLGKHFTRATATQILRRLTQLGLVVAGRRPGFGKAKPFTVRRRRYHVGRAQRSKGTAPEFDTLIDHVEEIVRRVRHIEALGFTVEVREGKIHFYRLTNTSDEPSE